MENKLDYIVKYKMEEIKIKRKYELKIVYFLLFLVAFIFISTPIIIYILSKSTGMWWIYSELVIIPLIILGLKALNRYLYFDKVNLIVKDGMLGYKIPIENLLNVYIKKNAHQKLLIIRYIERSEVITIKIILEGYKVSLLYNEEELKTFINFFKTKTECENESISGEYFDINRKYSDEEIQEMLNDGIKKAQKTETIGMKAAIILICFVCLSPLIPLLIELLIEL